MVIFLGIFIKYQIYIENATYKNKQKIAKKEMKNIDKNNTKR